MQSFWQWRHPMPFSNPFQKKSSPNDKKGKKFGGIKNIAYFCGQSWSRRKRTAAMKTQMNERIERYPRIEMWKFRNLLG